MKISERILHGESQASFYQVVLGVWFLVWVFAALHDQYLIRIHPEHFTVWHYRIGWTSDYTLLAIAYAFGASITPGLVLGVVLYVVGRLFDRPKVRVRTILVGVVIVAVAVEVCALAAGFVAWQTGRPVYPEWLYPDESKGIFVTQSIQITAYLAGMVFSLGLIGVLGRMRCRVVG